MNSAPQVRTAEISDAELDNVSGGLSTPHAGVYAGPLALTDSDALAQVGAATNEVAGTLGQYRQFGAFVSF